MDPYRLQYNDVGDKIARLNDCSITYYQLTINCYNVVINGSPFAVD